MINFRFIANLMGRLLLIESAFLLLCVLIALIYGEHDASAFFYTSLITMSAGFLLSKLIKIKDRVLAKKDGYFMVTMVWIIFSLFGSLPYMIGNTIPSFADAFFETMSGFTTTGSSILNHVEALPHATLFWRSLTQWLGGLGIIMLFIAIFPANVDSLHHPDTSTNPFAPIRRNESLRWYLSCIHHDGHRRILDQTK